MEMEKLQKIIFVTLCMAFIASLVFGEIIAKNIPYEECYYKYTTEKYVIEPNLYVIGGLTVPKGYDNLVCDKNVIIFEWTDSTEVINQENETTTCLATYKEKICKTVYPKQVIKE